MTRRRSSAASCAPRRSAPRSSCFPAAATPRRTDASRTRSACCSGARRRSIRRAMRAARPGSCTTSARRLKEKAQPDPRPRNAGLQRADLGLSDCTVAHARAGRRRGAAGDQRLHRGRSARWSTGFSELQSGRHRRPAAAGSTPASSGGRRTIARTSASRADRYGHGWGFAWPADRRILYNRASARPDGKPWSERKKLVWWDARSKEWTGYDVARLHEDKRPTIGRRRTPRATQRSPAMSPSSCIPMASAGSGCPPACKDGPLPTHYEPLESPVANPLYPRSRSNPAADREGAAGQPLRRLRRSTLSARADDLPADRASHGRRDVAHAFAPGGVAAGVVLRDLAGAGGRARRRARRLASRIVDRARHRSRRARWSRRACDRSPIDGRRVHQVGLPYHWGTRGLVTGDVVNDLVAISEEPNVRIMEAKGCSATSSGRGREAQSAD